MSQLHRQWISRGFLIVCMMAGVGLSLLWTSSVQAVLPPRPTVTADDDTDDVSSTLPTVNQIYLRLTPADQTYWSVVQWQDAQGMWHDVESWRGEVTHGEIGWWVAEKDFGKGPFRWAVYPQDGPFIERVDRNTIYRKAQPMLAVSQPFYLPAGSSSPLGVFVTVGSY